MEEKINEILVEIFELKESDINEKLTRDDIALWDSLNHLRMITSVEEEFGIRLSMDEIQFIDSVEKLKKTIKVHLVTT